MRPISLKMYGFGPFMTETEVEFEKLGKKGIFLITGTTGSGKTSIFDAILYALYGKASGENRDPSMLKSLSLPDGEKPYVIYEFEVRGNRYVINRNLSYKRKAKRGDGFTDESAAASISCNGELLLDEKVSSTKDPIALKVQEILGVDYKQFKMLSILPQGEFEKFLLAKTDERKQILQKLFDTSLYAKFQVRVDEEYKKLTSQVSEQNGVKKTHISKLECSGESVFMEELSASQNDKLADDKLICLIQNIIDEDKKSAEQIDKVKTTLNEELGKINQDIGKANEYKSNCENLSLAQESLKNFNEKKTSLEKLKETAQNNIKRKPEIDKEVGAMESCLKDYDAMNELIKKKANLKKSIEDLTDGVKANEEELEKLKIEEKNSKDKIEELEKAGENKAKFEQELQKYINIQKQLDDLKACKEESLECFNDKEIKQSSAKTAIEKSESASNLYIQLNKRFNLAQAGILAMSLEEGKPCPVCGSLEHPIPACIASDVPSEDEVKTAQKNADSLSKKASDASSISAVANAKFEESTKTLNKKYSELFEEDIMFSDENWYDGINSKLCSKEKELKTNIDDVTSKIKTEEENIKLKNRLKNSLPELENKITGLSESINENKIKSGKASGELEQTCAQIEELSKKLPFENKSMIEEVISKKKAESDSLQKEFDKATSDYNKCVADISGTEGQIKALKEAILKTGDINLDELLEAKNSIESKIDINDEKSKEVSSRINNNESCFKSIKKVIDSVSDINKRIMVIEPISKTMNGGLSGKAKVDLETFVLQTFFNRIIRRANIRLKEMTNNNYELKISPEQKQNKGKTGLELSVIDHFSSDGLERDVHSLSGGEKFKASLSLALGLSDEISAMSGGIRLDSLYIDEGFGSLDRESLESAIRIINDLTDGDVLVGIISHVEILKERVNKKIIVTKLKHGSSIDVEV